MADEQMTPEQVAELQKKNCIFCRIIAGEIDSKKVFENDSYLGILDIRPAAPGHVLFMPKEHVPILPLLPEEKMVEYLQLAVELGGCVQEAMISSRVTLLTASGFAAGQQAPHLMIHIIPRDNGDGLTMLDLDVLNTPQADAIALNATFAEATKQALTHRKRDDLFRQHHIHKKMPESSPGQVSPAVQDAPIPVKEAEPAPEVEMPPPEAAPQTEEFTTTSDALEAALAMAPDLRRLIIAQPDLVSEYVTRSPKLAKLFEGVNIRALSLLLQRQEAKKPVDRIAKDMTEVELFAFIDGNEGLRSWILEQPEELAQRVAENPRLQRFFTDINITDLAQRYHAYREAQGGR